MQIVRIVRTLRVVEDALYSCKEKLIDTPEVNGALDFIEIHTGRIRRYIVKFRQDMKPNAGAVMLAAEREFNLTVPERYRGGLTNDPRERQQRQLRGYFVRMHSGVKCQLRTHIKKQECRYSAEGGDGLKANID